MEYKNDMELIQDFLSDLQKLYDIPRDSYKSPWKAKVNDVSTDIYLDWMNPHGSRKCAYPLVLSAFQRILSKTKPNKKSNDDIKDVIRKGNETTQKLFIEKANELNSILQHMTIGKKQMLSLPSFTNETALVKK